jgi:hypothetical protein
MDRMVDGMLAAEEQRAGSSPYVALAEPAG